MSVAYAHIGPIWDSDASNISLGNYPLDITLPLTPCHYLCQYPQEVCVPRPLQLIERPLNCQMNKKTLPNCDKFLLFDSGVGDYDRILIFGMDRTSSLLVQSPNLFMDWTLAIVPE